MITIEINQKQYKAKTGEVLLQVLRRNSIQVPTLCHMENLPPTGACRMCVVEVEGQRNLVPSCAFTAQDGMKVQTHSQRVLRARKMIVELLLSSHPEDCFYCERNQNCELQKLAVELGVREKRFCGEKGNHKLDVSSPAILRDPSKCILCGRCVRVCEEVQGVSAIDFTHRGCRTTVATAFQEGLNLSSCVHCGQCVLVCPTGALVENPHLSRVLEALRDPQRVVVVQHAPAVSVTVGEEFGLKEGLDTTGLLNAAFRRMGFKRVFDTSFSADLTIMEEASELVERIQSGGVLPMMTSCSPGWIKFVEQSYPEFVGNLSTCKSPQQMMGALLKSYYARKHGINPSQIFSVSVMPCTAKKFEAQRSEMASQGLSDVDAVMTTRELCSMLRLFGVDLARLEPEEADTPFGERSTAGKLFGATGGVMEAALRTAHYFLTGKNLADPVVTEVRSLNGVKEAKLEIAGLKIGVAVVSGLKNARALLEEIKKGRNDLHFIEVMTCPGGCIAGGGQPHGTNRDKITARMQSLYGIDRRGSLRFSHENQFVAQLYQEFLGKPLGEKSHALLHTHYSRRDVVA